MSWSRTGASVPCFSAKVQAYRRVEEAKESRPCTRPKCVCLDMGKPMECAAPGSASQSERVHLQGQCRARDDTTTLAPGAASQGFARPAFIGRGRSVPFDGPPRLLLLDAGRRAQGEESKGPST